MSRSDRCEWCGRSDLVKSDYSFAVVFAIYFAWIVTAIFGAFCIGVMIITANPVN